MAEPSFGEEIDCGSFFDHIDDLLDFPTDGVDTCFATNSVFPTIWPNQSEPFPTSDSAFSGNANSADLTAELSVPYEDIVPLEWLSSFVEVEDSFSNGCLSMKKQDSASDEKCTDFTYYQFQTTSPISVLESSSSSSGEKSFISDSSEIVTPACRGVRSKRTRPPTFCRRPVIQTSVGLFYSETPVESPGLVEIPEPEEEKEIKKKKKMNPKSASEGVRKCLHCEVTRTPQWRAGPMGPKTLCNACGVRHKSGRLFPEYRPAASPTFVPSLHSNSHKRVAEMRKKAADDSAPSAVFPKAC